MLLEDGLELDRSCEVPVKRRAWRHPVA
jgi:hypothetical protein